MTETTCDLMVVGAGPAGLYAAYYAGFRGLSVAVVDTLPEPGGQVTGDVPGEDDLRRRGVRGHQGA